MRRVFLIFLMLLLAAQISPWWRPGEDDCAYLSMARSIAAGGPAARFGSPQLFFAPGYPLLISPAFLLSDRPFLVLHVLHWILAILLLAGIHRWSRRLFPQGAVLLTGLVMANASLWIYYRRTLSELAFMAALIWTVEVLELALKAASPRKTVAWTALGGLALAFLCAIRQAGLCLAAGFLAALAWEVRRGRLRWRPAAWQALAAALPAVLAVSALAAYDRAMAAESPQASRTYVDHLFDRSAALPAQLLEGLRLRISAIGRLLVPGMVKAYAKSGEWFNINLLVYVPVAAAAAVGWWRWVRHTRDLFALTAPFYLGLYILWPFGQDTRFMLPLLPVLWAGLGLLLEPLGRWRAGLLAALFVGHLGVSVGFWIREARQLRELDREWPAIEKLAEAYRKDPRSVNVAGLGDDQQLMLQLLVDQKISDGH
ncbi:MAG: hypothetical protein HY717_02415 [Planctomycetes bacterium]|nr:hypothetical protein [Planctomycetota bacterium]